MAIETEILAEARLRREQRLHRLATAPTVDVVGVVDSQGVTSGQLAGDKLVELRLTMDAWRIHHADVMQIRPLMFTRLVSQAELDRFAQLICAGTVVCLRARFVDDTTRSPEALLEGFVGMATADDELNEHAQRLRDQHRAVVDDPLLGVLTFDRELGGFEGSCQWNDRAVSLHLAARESPAIQAAVETARSLWDSQVIWDRRIRDYAIAILLPRKNDTWLSENERRLTADQFNQRISLHAVTANPDGSFEFWHEAGDLFWGHSILISGNLTDGLNYADIPG